jgi:hypothetical protein
MGPCKSREGEADSTPYFEKSPAWEEGEAGTNYTHAQNTTSESSGIQAESTNFMIGSNHLHFNCKSKEMRADIAIQLQK